MKVSKGSSLLLMTLLAFLPAIHVDAQTSDKERQRAIKVKSDIVKLGTGNQTRVKVKLYSGTVYEGTVSQSGEDDFVVETQSGGRNTIRYDEVRSIGGRNLSSGAKIAIGVGIGAGATLLVLYLVFRNITANN